MLFFEPPAPGQVREQFPHIQAVGLAGMNRTMTPEEMDAALPQAFAGLKALGAPVTHYKVCSTFDSSPQIGSIGRAAEIGMQVFRPAIVPVVVGAPKLNRYVVFGNLFATLDEITYRLDRHPVMSRHPVTPMDESDLRRHLGKQTDVKIGLLDVRRLAASDDEIDAFLEQQIDARVALVIVDTLDRSHLLKVGRLLGSLGQNRQAFVVGSSGVEFALAEHWQAQGLIQPPQEFTSPGSVEKIVAISGSASPWTAKQIGWALEHGFQGIAIDSARLMDARNQAAERSRLVGQAVRTLAGGRSVLLYSTLGPDDPQITVAKSRLEAAGLPPGKAGEILGVQQGLILRDILLQTGLHRAAVAGGDTCGHVLKQLGVYVLEFMIPLGTAAPLCRAGSKNLQLEGLQVALKGGQLGEIDFFGSVLSGKQD
jgi:uncharacterized protein YgbK (DUF1537 family)